MAGQRRAAVASGFKDIAAAVAGPAVERVEFGTECCAEPIRRAARTGGTPLANTGDVIDMQHLAPDGAGRS
jgi:hypothetical protein